MVIINPKSPGRNPSELGHVGRDIASTDAKIDDLVYELYGISDKERRMVEGDGRKNFGY